MASLSTPEVRETVIGVAVTSARHAAALAIGITGRPQGYVNPTEIENATMESTTTTAPSTTAAQDIASQATAEDGGSVAGEAAVTASAVPEVYAMPATFGAVGADADRDRCAERGRDADDDQPGHAEPQLVRVRVHGADRRLSGTLDARR